MIKSGFERKRYIGGIVLLLCGGLLYAQEGFTGPGSGQAVTVDQVTTRAHEEGDITLNPEFQGGFVFPVIVPDFNAMGIDGNDAGSVGFDYAVKITGNYFFKPHFSANIGFGIGGILVYSGYDYDNAGREVKINNTYRTTFVTVPFGVRYNIGTFLIGGGFAVAIPFESYHEGKNDGDNTTIHDDRFTANPFLSWYIDLGLDFANRKGRSSGLGAALRIGSSFSDIAKNTQDQKFTNFGYANVSLVLNYMFKIAKIGNS
jgi:hypothetical protein